MITNVSEYLDLFVFNEKRSPADVRLKAALTDE